MAKYTGTKLKIMSDGVVISDLIDVGFEINGETIPVTTKDSNDWKEILMGIKSAKMTGSADLNSASTLAPSFIFAKISAGTSCAVIFYHTVTGQLSYSATGYYVKFSQKGAVGERIMVDFEIECTGTVTQTATT